MGRMKDRAAIVTGAGAGIGAICAQRLSQEGARLIVADLVFDSAQEIAARIVQTGGEAVACRFDLADEGSIKDLVEFSLKRYGPCTILCNNAVDQSATQMSLDGMIGDMDAAVWDRAFTVNARGTMLMIKHAVAPMIEAGGGSIINMSSGASLRGDLSAPAYAASKAAINCLTLYVATQYGRMNIRCNAVAPGLILTPSVRETVPSSRIAGVRAHAPLDYLGEPEDVAGVVAFLASDDARNMSGQIVEVDGGYIAHMPHYADALRAG